MPRVAAGGKARTCVPDPAQGAVIADFVRVLNEAGLSTPESRPALAAADGERLELPESMYDVLSSVHVSLRGAVQPRKCTISHSGPRSMAFSGHQTGRRCAFERHGGERGPVERDADLAGGRRLPRDLPPDVVDAEEDGLYEHLDRPAPRTR